MGLSPDFEKLIWPNWPRVQTIGIGRKTIYELTRGDILVQLTKSHINYLVEHKFSDLRSLIVSCQGVVQLGGLIQGKA